MKKAWVPYSEYFISMFQGTKRKVKERKGKSGGGEDVREEREVRGGEEREERGGEEREERV